MTDRIAPAPTPRVLVVVLTYRRNDLLRRLLPLVDRQVRDLTSARAEVLVVDNDPGGGARPVVDGAGGGPGTAVVHYLHEPRPGIAAARNAALRHAQDGAAAAVAFLDDDETPGPGWLATLVGAWTAWGCAGVAGPARRTFDGEVAPWVGLSGFFARTVRPTGSTVAGAATNNLLLDLAVLRDTGLTFDERFGLTGGSDTLLTRSLSALGHRIRWCDEAEVLDPVPAARATRSWVLRRSFRTGTTWSRVHLRLPAPATASRVPPALRAVLRSVVVRADLTVRGLARIAGNLLPALASGSGVRLARGPRAQCRVAGGLGMLLGAWGYAYVEYRRPTGGGQGPC